MEPTAAPQQTVKPLIVRRFTQAGEDPLEQVEWKTFEVDEKIFNLPAVEAPVFWSQNAVNITAKLYLSRGVVPETSVKQLIRRVASKIVFEGVKNGYFELADGVVLENSLSGWGGDEAEAQIFYDELCYILVNQLAAFNSPVWFNVGRSDRKQQCSACFLLAVDDNTESILGWADQEAHIFKGGSGAGANVSNLRGSMESLSTGGTASGPVSFMRLADAGAGTFKSGGTTRRAAKLVALDVDHPDIRDFIHCKTREEERLRILLEAGIDVSMSPEGERNRAELTAYQNANNSVRVTDDFMERATDVLRRPSEWPLLARKTGEIVEKVHAGELLDEIAQAAWACADPGLQFHDTINDWHTTPSHGPIRTTNPCAEVHQPDDTSCNLASINLIKFVGDPGRDDPGYVKVNDFRHVVDVMTTAMDITCSFSYLPTEALKKNTRELRQLGLGYSNLGAAVMSQGMPYDSEMARNFAAGMTALMTGRAYRKSAELAEKVGAFEHFEQNREVMLKVINQHMLSLRTESPLEFWAAACEDWEVARESGAQHGYRNAQATVLAPSGTISFFMDCDTTGIEPAFDLVSNKDLAGGGSMTMINSSVKRGAQFLGGYSNENLERLAEGDISCVSPEDLSVFACARDISPTAHVEMVAAVQPFLSGAPSKTVNLPNEATWEEIRDLYVFAWKSGVKAIAIYRDGSKAIQVLARKLSAKTEENSDEADRDPAEGAVGELPKAATPHAEDQYEGFVGPQRRRMPRTSSMIRHKFNIAGFEGYLLAGMFEDSSLGEIFIEDIGKEGSTLRGMMNTWAIAISMALQYGVPLEVLARKYSHMRFEPEGLTETPEIRVARSLPDYIMRWLALQFLGPDIHEELGIMSDEVKIKKLEELGEMPDVETTSGEHVVITGRGAGEIITTQEVKNRAQHMGLGVSTNGHASSPDYSAACGQCGGMMQRTGACYTCSSCGHNTGCG